MPAGHAQRSARRAERGRGRHPAAGGVRRRLAAHRPLDRGGHDRRARHRRGRGDLAALPGGASPGGAGGPAHGRGGGGDRAAHRPRRRLLPGPGRLQRRQCPRLAGEHHHPVAAAGRGGRRRTGSTDPVAARPGPAARLPAGELGLGGPVRGTGVGLHSPMDGRPGGGPGRRSGRAQLAAGGRVPRRLLVGGTPVTTAGPPWPAPPGDAGRVTTLRHAAFPGAGQGSPASGCVVAGSPGPKSRSWISGTCQATAAQAATVRPGSSTAFSNVPPARTESARGVVTWYQVRPRIGIGHNSGQPWCVIMSPNRCTTQPTPTATPTSGYPSTGRALAASRVITAETVVVTSQPRFRAHSAIRPRSASARVKNSTPSTTGRPNRATSRLSATPSSTAKARVWVRVRCPLRRRGSRLVRVSRYTPRDSFSTHSARNSDTIPNVRAAV